MTKTIWSKWHDAYARPGSGLATGWRRSPPSSSATWTSPHRTRYVRSAPARATDATWSAWRTDADRVTALLVEYDARLGTRAREAARTLPAQVAVRRADAAQSDIYAHAVPADLVPLCAASSATSATLTGGRPCTRHRNSALRVPR